MERDSTGNPHRSFDLAQDGELVELLCARLERWRLH